MNKLQKITIIILAIISIGGLGSMVIQSQPVEATKETYSILSTTITPHGIRPIYLGEFPLNYFVTFLTPNGIITIRVVAFSNVFIIPDGKMMIEVESRGSLWNMGDPEIEVLLRQADSTLALTSYTFRIHVAKLE